ncbi:MAG: cobalamin-dependent protein [Deltaproteobacteria bacterium]|nr:cobalamin-dependent protein [Deltaproteobacteria bacterium]
MTSKTILLITPPYHCGVVEVAGRWMPLGLLYLAGAARKAGWTPLLYDAMTKDHDHATIREELARIKPDCVAITAITATYPDALEVLRTARDLNPAVITLMGGVHPTFMYEEVLSQSSDLVDYCIRGEGEDTLTQLLPCLAEGKEPHDVPGLAFERDGEIVVTPERPFMLDLDQPVASWDLVDWDDYRYFVIPNSRLAVVSTARGCSFSCTFCSQQKFYKQTWRGRDPARSADEILGLWRQHGVNVFLIADEYPTSSKERWLEFLERLIAAKFDGYLLMETRAPDIVRDADILSRYRKAGVVHVYVGLEATDQVTLDAVKKELNVDESKEALKLLYAHGIVSETSFVLGFPWDTEASIQTTLDLARSYDPDFGHFLTITPWPYADIYEELKPHIEEWDYRHYNLVDPIVRPIAMTLAEVDKALMDCYRRFYMGKLKAFDEDPDPFRKRYMLTGMHLMMRSSFLKQKMGTLGRIPYEVERMLRSLKSKM